MMRVGFRASRVWVMAVGERRSRCRMGGEARVRPVPVTV